VQRDARHVRALRAAGWRVFTAWECRLNTPSKAAAEANRLVRRIVGS
jgi:G:T-mismatch repair DNA endonuclease (very short patch repair protein)